MHLDLSEADRELLEERAAILEYDAGWPRPIAESEATRHVCRLYGNAAPSTWERGVAVQLLAALQDLSDR